MSYHFEVTITLTCNVDSAILDVGFEARFLRNLRQLVTKVFAGRYDATWKTLAGKAYGQVRRSHAVGMLYLVT
jgi:hypothetical protein